METPSASPAAGRPGWSSRCCSPAGASTSPCWRSTPTSCATSVATPSIRRRSMCSTRSGSGPAVERLPGRPAGALRVTFDDGTFTVADFRRLPGAHPYLLFLPQWDLLDMLADEAAALPGFTLLRSTEVTDLLRGTGGRVDGVRRGRPGRRGRGARPAHRRLRRPCVGRTGRLGLRPVEFGAPMDVLWFRLPREPDDPADVGVPDRRGRPDDLHRPRRLLPVRLRHRQGRLRRDSRGRPRRPAASASSGGRRSSPTGSRNCAPGTT